MPFDFQSFVNPSQFSDAANYAGFNGQMKSVEDAEKEDAMASILGAAVPNADGTTGVKPPATTVQELFNNKLVNPINNAFGQIKKQANSVVNSFNQLGQGNSAGTSSAATEPQQDSYLNRLP